MTTRVFVGGLKYGIKSRDVEKFFSRCGRVNEVSMKNGFAFVEFDDYRDAEDAVYELNGRELLGERVYVEKARGTPRGQDRFRMGSYGPPRPKGRYSRAVEKYGPPVRTGYRLIVENLSSEINWRDLKDYMRKGGRVTFADAHKKRKNEGVVEFASYSDMKNAIKELDDTELNGKRITLTEDRRSGSKRPRTPSESRSRSRSRKRSAGSRSGSYRSRSKQEKSRSRSVSRNRSRSPSISRNKYSKSRSPPNKSLEVDSESRRQSEDKLKGSKRARLSTSRSRSRSKSKRSSRGYRSRSRSHSAQSRSRSRTLSGGAKSKSPLQSRSMT